MQSLEIILENFDGNLTVAEKEKMAEEKNEIYRGLLNTMKPEDVTQEIRDTLKELRNCGYKLAIGSSSKNARFILEKVQLMNYFDAVSDGTNISKSKPDPEVFLKAAEFIKESPENCMVVEDAIAGIDAAKAGGMKAAGIGQAADYEKTDFSIQKFSDLLQVISEK